MSDLATERRHLAKAERDLVEGEDRIARQAGLVEQLRGHGRDTAGAEALLETLRRTLEAWRDHRDTILRTVARLEGAPAGPSAEASPP